MPRPKNKIELINESNKNYQALIAHIDNLGDKLTDEFPKGTLNRNVKDVLAHLHHWHLLFEEWYAIGMAGGKPDMPAKGFTWKTLPELNKQIWEKYKDESFDAILSKFQSSFKQIQRFIEKHSDEELFTKKKYKWTGTTSLGAYLVSAASSHYIWALKLIKKQLK